MTTKKTTQKNEDWWESDWYKEWLELAKRDYHGKREGYWACYYNSKNELIYVYVHM